MDIGLQGVPGWKNGNIISLDIPKELDDTLSISDKKSSMSWFNDVMGGEGLTPSQVVLFTGDPGIGKTTTLLQLADAFHGAGRGKDSNCRVIVIYNTNEESLFQVRRTVRRLNLKDGFLATQFRMLNDLLAFVDKTQASHPSVKILVIQDSLQTLDDGYYKDGGITSGTNLRCMEAIVKHAKEKWSTWIMIGQVTKNGDSAGKNSLIHACDAHLQFRFDTAKRSETCGERLMHTSKNRFGSAGVTYVLGMTEKGTYSKGRLIDLVGADKDA